MSVIAFKDGVLCADSRGEAIIKGLTEPQIFRIGKIHISPCNRIAVAVVGHSLTKDALTKLFDGLLTMLLEHSITGELPELLNEPEMYITDELGILVMTKDHLFHREGRSLTTNPELRSISLGSGCNVAKTLMTIGYSAVDALIRTCELRPTMAIPLSVINQSSLSPIRAGD